MRVHHISIEVADVQAAAAQYRLVGFTDYPDPPETIGQNGGCWLLVPGSSAALHILPKGGSGPHFALTIPDDEFESRQSECAAAGFEIKIPKVDIGLRRFYAFAPDGNMIEYIVEK